MADVRLIDSKALLKALRKEKRECEKDGEEFGGESILYAEAFEDAIDMVKNLPVVDAVPVVHGRWEYAGFLAVKCSECKGIFYELGETNYCPNCGARMDGGASDG